MTANKTTRKRAFYLVFAAIVRDCSASEVIDNWDEKDILTFPNEALEIARKWDESKAQLDEFIVQNITKASLSSVPNVDLAIIYVYCVSKMLGEESKRLLLEISKFADEFGATQSSSAFCRAIFSKYCN